MGIRVVVQQVSSASLLIDNNDKWISISQGIIVYVCFLKDSDEEEIKKCGKTTFEQMTFMIMFQKKQKCSVESILSLGIMFDEHWKKNKSVIEAKGDILVVPQASLAGKMKQKKMQYHSLIEKEKGEVLYSKFVNLLKNGMQQEFSKESTKDNSSTFTEVSQKSEKQEEVNTTTSKESPKLPEVKAGVFGNRQGLKFESPGPFCHIFLEF